MPAVTRLEEYRNLLDAQRALAVDIQDKETSPRDRSNAAKTLVAVIDMKRIMRGIGKPKPVEPAKARRTPSSATPLDPS